MKSKTLVKRILSVVLTVLMAAALALPAMAASIPDEQTSYGFFQSVGATKALQALNSAKYGSYIHKGDSQDATSLQNMYKALDIIEKCNQLRAQEGKSELKVTDTLMAMAQADADYSVIAIGHAQQYQVAENCAFGGSNPFDGWYTDEKNNYVTKNGGQTGHYLNIVNGQYTCTGAAYTENAKGQYGDCYAQTFYFDANGDQTYTVSEYRARLQNYAASVGVQLS